MEAGVVNTSSMLQILCSVFTQSTLCSMCNDVQKVISRYSSVVFEHRQKEMHVSTEIKKSCES